MLPIQETTCLSMRKRISSNTSVIEVHQIIPCETGGQHTLVPLAALDGFHLNMLQNGIGLEKVHLIF